MDNSLLIKALLCKGPDRIPAWFMRQAGRYLPEYRQLRQRHSFLDLCRTPELAAQVTCLPLNILNPDAAILFADILLLLPPFGLDLSFEEQQGPLISNPLEKPGDLFRLKLTHITEELSHVFETIKLLKKDISVPLIGFSGAPFTLATYMIEGKTGSSFKRTKEWIYNHPNELHKLLDTLTTTVIEYLKGQIKAGVDAIQIFDSWAHIIPHHLIHTFSAQYLKRIVDALRPFNIPIILFARSMSLFIDQFIRVNPHCLSLDQQADMVKMRKAFPNISFQGNLDPDLLYAPKHVIKKELDNLLAGMKDDKGYIFNLGHGIKPDTPVDSAKFVIDYVKSIK